VVKVNKTQTSKEVRRREKKENGRFPTIFFQFASKAYNP
jgi:hypothetical protein